MNFKVGDWVKVIAWDNDIGRIDMIYMSVFGYTCARVSMLMNINTFFNAIIEEPKKVELIVATPEEVFLYRLEN